MICASWNNITSIIVQVKTKVDNLKMLWKNWIALGKQSGFMKYGEKAV